MIDRSIHVCYIAYYFTVFKHTTVAFICPKGENIKIERITDKRKCEIHWHESIGENIIENFTYVLLTNAQNIKSFEQYSYFESNELRNTINLNVTDNK